ncbi:tRNA pseudouridine(55) synthase TruB [Candidatus Saccharibacteria bacterium]|nr:MAG: tRNA pseudouridine(55) synthase TruB [Candidatus Saccharibacteria bacterium]
MITDGIVCIDKPSGMSSFGVVARVRRVLSQAAGRKVKVGHTGTLDPFATGLMILVVGSECKRAAAYSKLDKVYTATIVLGTTSSTGDPEGELTIVDHVQRPSIEDVRAVIRQFVGPIQQRPPVFSAVKIGGRRAYQRARAGEAVEMPTRQVTVHSLELIEYAFPTLVITAHVSSGTYIRSLAADIGEALGTGAYCRELRRESIADWQVSEALSLEAMGIDS